MKSSGIAAMKTASLAFGRLTSPKVIVLSSVSFNPSDQAYTYTYVIDNRLGLVPISEFSVLVDSKHQNSALVPSAHGGPDGWAFATSLSGSIADPPVSEFGTFWAWNNHHGIPAGSVSTPFFFTTSRIANTYLNNNFFLFSDTPGAG